MPSTVLPPALRADKALVRQIADFDDSVEVAEDFADLMVKNTSQKASLKKDAAALRKRMGMALGEKEPRTLAKAVAVLVKDAAKLADNAAQWNSQDLYDRYMPLWTKARGLLAQALVEVGAIEPLALRQPLQKEQAALRAELDEIERTNIAASGNIAELEKMLPRIDAFVKRLDPVRRAGDWMRGSYLPQLARVEAAIKRVPAQRCRKSLLAELDFVGVDTAKALGRGDVKAVQARCLPALQRVERLAARIVAASPAIDRELARLARLIGGASDVQRAGRLKAMIQAKATTWPDGADADAIDTALTRFEADLARLGTEIEKTDTVTSKATAKA